MMQESRVELSGKGQQDEPKPRGLCGAMWDIEKDLEVTMSPSPFLSWRYVAEKDPPHICLATAQCRREQWA